MDAHKVSIKFPIKKHQMRNMKERREEDSSSLDIPMAIIATHKYGWSVMKERPTRPYKRVTKSQINQLQGVH